MPDPSQPTFEEALTQLEQIVADLERGQPALSAALAQYETGVQLLRHCYRMLEQAEQSVALLTGVDARGTPVTAPFDASATLALEPGSPPAAGLEPLDRAARAPAQVASWNDRSEPSDPPF
jgi:exodeoxyribonuclease VII small subunit